MYAHSMYARCVHFNSWSNWNELARLSAQSCGPPWTLGVLEAASMLALVLRDAIGYWHPAQLCIFLTLTYSKTYYSNSAHYELVFDLSMSHSVARISVSPR